MYKFIQSVFLVFSALLFLPKIAHPGSLASVYAEIGNAEWTGQMAGVSLHSDNGPAGGYVALAMGDDVFRQEVGIYARQLTWYFGAGFAHDVGPTQHVWMPVFDLEEETVTTIGRTLSDQILTRTSTVLFIGLRNPGTRPFVEGRVLVGDETHVALKVGVGF